MLGAGAVGGVLGALVTSRVARRIGIGPAFAVGCVVFPAPLLLVPLAEGPQLVILACLFLAEFGSGIGVMMLDITVGAIFAAVIPDRLRSRISGAYTVVNYGVRPLGALAGGALGPGSACARPSGSRPPVRCRLPLAPPVADPRAPRAARAKTPRAPAEAPSVDRVRA